jgi:acetyltransferase-like isoleucine patch superfamily enzyme
MVQNGACIAYGVIINDKAFIGPGVMTNHTKQIMWQRNLPEFDLITQIGYGAIIGSASSLIAGLTIGDNVFVAAGSNVYKDINEPGIYGGNPIKKIKDLDPIRILKRPAGYMNYEFNTNIIEKYIKQWNG